LFHRGGRHIRAASYITALASGAALVLCFPVFDYHLLAFAALSPFLISLWRKPARDAFKAGVALGIPYFFGTQYWIYHSISHYGGVPLVMSFVIVLLLALYLSLYTGLFGLLYSRLINRTSLPAVLVAPVLWVALEFARSYVFTGFPWSSLGYSQYKFLPFIQFADLTGIYGVSFLIMAVNGLLADLFITGKRREEMPLFNVFPVLAGGLLLMAVLAAVFVYGNRRLAEDRPGEPVTVSVIQGNIEQDVKWEPEYQGFVLKTYKDLSRAAVAEAPEGGLDMVVWPESALPFYFGHDMELTGEFLAFQRRLATPLLFGAITVKRRADGYDLGNSALLLSADGEPAYAYDKIHLVPFGEYVPLKWLLFFLDKLVVGIGDYMPGDRYVRAQTPFGEFGAVICYEIIFPGLVRKFYRDGGDFIVTITNDAWFGRTTGPYQHWSMAVLRAVENRKPVVRAANTGISGFIDSSGRIMSRTGLFEPAVLTGTVKTDRTRTVYSRYGDVLPYLCVLLGVILIARRK
jgi:apolipoprotein N-acyltransferase